MATPLARRPEPGDGSAQAAVTISAVTEYLLPATMRGVAVQAVAALGVLTGLWIALSPSFLTLQHGGGNAAAANLIAGLAVAAVAAASLAVMTVSIVDPAYGIRPGPGSTGRSTRTRQRRIMLSG